MKKGLLIFIFIIELSCYVFSQGNALKMVKIPGMNIKMLATEVTQNLYELVMGEIPENLISLTTDISPVVGEDQDMRPIGSVSFYDALYFCNKLSEMSGLKPVYTFNGSTDVKAWNYIPHNAKYLKGNIRLKKNADGYRLPTVEEWQYAAKSGETYLYAGSNDIDEVAWYKDNSDRSHQVGMKKSNQYGLYDMTGNVSEWCWDWPIYIEFYSESQSEFNPTLGGSFKDNETACMLRKEKTTLVNFSSRYVGFRIVCLDKE
ncbi:MAG: hypothetical protein E7062_09395 [Spirochaetaceae bacterium]|nr:hypothetical protein [Spirochaetaceae bacterium]